MLVAAVMNYMVIYVKEMYEVVTIDLVLLD